MTRDGCCHAHPFVLDQKFFDLLPAAVYACDTAGVIQYYNRRAIELWGRQPAGGAKEQRYCGALRVYDADGRRLDPANTSMAHALATDRPQRNAEAIIERPDGSRVKVLINIDPVRNARGKLIGAVCILQDISDRKRADEALREQTDALRDAERRKDDFLAALAHELRNPLAPLRSALHLMRVAGPNTAVFDQARAMMDRQLQQMIHIVDDLLEVSRISRNQLELRREEVELAKIVQAAVETAQPIFEAAGLHLIVRLPRDPMPLLADATRLTQVFVNLLNNAVKHTAPGGQILLTAVCEKGHVMVTLADDGIGIPGEQLPHVFDMFSQPDSSLKYSQAGFGVDLTVVKHLVEMHGGNIEAASEGPGTGTRFLLRFPLTPSPEISAAFSGTPQPAPRRRILVVDDNRDSADSLGCLLTTVGHEVHIAHDGIQAMEIAAALPPDVVLLDLGMPRLSGHDVARRLRAQSWGKPLLLIALTGWGQEEDRRRTYEAGFDHHLLKPIDLDTLEELLAQK